MRDRFIVDIPRSNRDEWEEISAFSTRQEAVAFAREHFGADEEGRISLISEIDDWDECTCEHDREQHENGTGPCEATASSGCRCACPSFQENTP